MSTGEEPCTLRSSDGRAYRCQNLWEALFPLTILFGEAIRGQKTAEICTLHSSCALVGNKAVALLGDSGAGKSTLALLLASYGAISVMNTAS